MAKAPNIHPPSQIHQSGFAPDSHLLNVKDYGATGDGRTLDTKAISRAVEACSHSGGCILLVPPGHYVTGTFELLSNVTLDLEPGAVLEGSTDVNDYGYLADYGFGRVYPVNSSGEGARMGMIIARNATNVSIIGQGTIDGRGDTFMDPHVPHFAGGFNPRLTRQGDAFLKAMHDVQFGPIQPKDEGRGRPGTLMIFSHCSNVLIRGVTIRNAPNWTVHFAYCTHVVATDFRILNSLLIPNDDGIDSISSRDVHISNCDIRAGDDDLAIVSSRNVTVTGCSLVSHSSAIRLANTRYGTFSNLTILSNRGIGVFHEKGDISKDLLFTNLVIRTRLITGDWWGNAEPIFISVAAGQKGNDTGYIESVRFSNIIINSEAGILINGAEDCPIRGISLQGIKLHIAAPAPEIAAEVGGNFD
ncbi:MAG: glycosyl hydrolase family 28 protein, partial [Acidobacteriota bacterium]